MLEKEQCQLGQRSISSAINMPDVKKVGWDKELQQDVVLPSNSKKIIKKVIQKKINKWKFYINLRNVLMIPFVL